MKKVLSLPLILSLFFTKLFAIRFSDINSNKQIPGLGKGFLFCAVIYLLTSLPFLGSYPLMDPDEGYYPSSAWEMSQRGNLIDPWFNHEVRWGKPVGIYALQALSFAAFGFNEWAARLPSVLAGLILVLATFRIAGIICGRQTAILAAFVAATFFQCIVYSRAAVPDMLLAAFTTAAHAGAADWLFRREGDKARLSLVLFYLGCGIAFLAKGPLGVILPAITVIATLIIARKPLEIRKFGLWWGVPLFLFATAPWFIYMYRTHGYAYIEEFFLRRNVQRYFTNRWEHDEPFYYYLPILLAGTLPWTIAFVSGIRSRLKSLFAGFGTSGPRDRYKKLADIFLLSWLIGQLVFFSFSRSKLPNYILPLYPAAAIIAALQLKEMFAAGFKNSAGKWFLYGTSAVCAIGITAAAFAVPGMENIGAGMVVLGLAPLGLLCIVYLFIAFKNRTGLIIPSTAIVTVLLFTVLTGFILPKVDEFRAVKELAENHLASEWNKNEQVLCFHVWPPSLEFYSHRKLIRFNPEKDDIADYVDSGGRWVLTREKSLPLLEKLTGGHGYRKVEQIGKHVIVKLH